MRQNGVHDIPPTFSKLMSMPLGVAAASFFPVGLLIVDGRVKAKILGEQLHFSSLPAMQRRGSPEFSDLSGDAAGRPAAAETTSVSPFLAARSPFRKNVSR